MLNTNQQKAVDASDKRLLVLAGAGSGKTTVLLSRISRLINSGINPSDILVLTFTNAAAMEMKDRYKRDNKGKKLPRFGTFHSFCYSLIISNLLIRKHMGYTDVPNIATDEDIKRVKSECKLICGTKLSDDILEGRKPRSIKDKFQYEIFWKQYDKMCKQKNLITFDKMCYSICQLFSENNAIIQKYKQQYRYIFIDEFQDTDKRQWEFASSFTDADIFVVGDVKQALYQFRGADSSIIKELASNPDWCTIKLSANYRSTTQICEFANKIHASWKSNPYNLDIISDKSGDAVDVREDVNIADIFDEMLDSINHGNVAVICRSNAEVSEVRSFLKSKNIPFKSNLRDNKNLDIIKSACDSEYCIEWLSGLLPVGSYNDYIKKSTLNPNISTEFEFFQNYGALVEKEMTKILNVRAILNGEMPTLSKLTSICNLLRIKCKSPKLSDNSRETLVSELERLSKPDTDDIKLYVGTIHSVKGLEYDTVYVLGVDGDSFRVSDGYEDLLNIYYVACTRAKKHLIICKASKEEYV